MTKKILLGLVAVVAMAGGVAAMSAFEAHVINVTAHIENALGVSTDNIRFGTVFPQEYLEEEFTVSLSQSFMDTEQTRVKDVQYKIVQKPKCICTPEGISATLCSEGEYAAVNYWDDKCPAGFEAMPDLCEFLSKMPVEADNDIGVPSYYKTSACPEGNNPCCVAPATHEATGRLEKCDPLDPDPTGCEPGDITDCWTVDLKVPPVEGYVGQDWPQSCSGYTVPTDGADYGCDLWIEVTGLSYFKRD